MKDKLRKYIDDMFRNAPNTEAAFDLKEELSGNLFEKYDDLTASGRTEEEAYDLAKNSLGDVASLIAELKTEDAEPVDIVKKRAFLNAIAVALYIASPIFVIGFGASGVIVIGLILMFICAAAATGLIVYNRTVYPKNKSTAAREAEADADRESDEPSKKKKEVWTSIYWIAVTIVFFVYSFATGTWYISWIIFLIAAVVEKILKIALSK